MIAAADWSQILEEVLARAGRTIPLLPYARSGLADSTAGISAARYDGVRSGPRPTDDGLDDDDAGGPDILLPPDKARRDKAEIAQILERMARDAYRLEMKTTEYARVGAPRDDPTHRATKEERKASEGESIDDESLCVSCIRIDGRNLRIGGTKLCGWCRSVVVEYGPPTDGKDPGTGPRWPQMTMPPVELVRDHLESQMGRQKMTTKEVEQRLRLCFGTPRRVTSGS